MTIKSFVSLSAVTAVISVVLTGCAVQPSVPSQQPSVTHVSANAYIGDFGKRIDAFTYTLTRQFTAHEFDTAKIRMTGTFLVQDKSGVNHQETRPIIIESRTMSHQRLILDVKDFASGHLQAIHVASNLPPLNQPVLDYQTITRTVGDFVHRYYTSTDGTRLSYWLYLPDTTMPLPLMVWEHGGGEVLATSYPGANLEANRGATAWIESGHPTAVLSVQYPENYAFGISEKPQQMRQMRRFNTAKYQLIESLIKAHKVDDHRVYIAGASSGGGAAIRFMMQYPQLFAGAVVIAAKDTLVPLSEKYGLAYKFTQDPHELRLSPANFRDSYQKMAQVLKATPLTAIPMWFAQAYNDHICTRYTTLMMYHILTQQGATHNHLTLYSDGQMQNAHTPFNHFSWVPTLNNQQIIDWVYAQHR